MSLSPPPVRRRRKRPNYALRRLMAALILLSPLLAWGGYRAWSLLTIPAEGDAPRIAKGPVYVAILGVDERQQDAGRSDTLMLLRLDQTNNRADVINIPRDTLITFDSGKESRINAAYAIGGADLTCEVVSELLGIPRPYYVKLNFAAFEEIVDALGGIDIDVEKHYVYSDPYQDLYIDIPAGPQHLMGSDALKYVRLRYDGVTDSDIGRIERQQRFLAALKEKLSSPAYFSRIPNLVEIVHQNVGTNIPEADQLTLAQGLYNARDTLTMRTLPGTPDDETGAWIMDAAEWERVKSEWTANPAPTN